jgi:hypothetical protein
MSSGASVTYEKIRAGCAGAKLEGYIPPCCYSYNAFGLDEAQSASNPPDFFFGGATRHEWTLPPATVCGAGPSRLTQAVMKGLP